MQGGQEFGADTSFENGDEEEQVPTDSRCSQNLDDVFGFGEDGLGGGDNFGGKKVVNNNDVKEEQKATAALELGHKVDGFPETLLPRAGPSPARGTRAWSDEESLDEGGGTTAGSSVFTKKKFSRN